MQLRIKNLKLYVSVYVFVYELGSLSKEILQAFTAGIFQFVVFCVTIIYGYVEW
jgi:hypothetical protein